MPGFLIFVMQRSAKGRSHPRSLFIMFLLFWVSCASQPLHEQVIGGFGRIVLHQSNVEHNGFVISVPHGTAERDAIEYAKTISDRTGAGLVIAYGFKANRIPVTQPLIHTTPISWRATDPVRPASVYPEFKKFLQSANVGPLIFYVGIRIAEEAKQAPRIEVASGGLSFEQLKFLKEAYTAIRDRSIKEMPIPVVEIALNPMDDISWNAFGSRNHGVLMLAEKGLILRLPKVVTLPQIKPVYRDIITEWVIEASTIARRASSQWPPVLVKKSPYGRIDLIPGRNNARGIVLGAPHGVLIGIRANWSRN